MYNLSDFVCCISQMKREFRASFHRSTKFLSTSISKHNSMGHLLPCAIDFKTNRPPYICGGLGYLVCQLSHAMLFQWGLANRKSPMRQLFAVPASIWRTLYALPAVVLHIDTTDISDIITEIDICPPDSTTTHIDTLITECQKHSYLTYLARWPKLRAPKCYFRLPYFLRNKIGLLFTLGIIMIST